MKSIPRILAVILLALPILWGAKASVQPEVSGDRTLSPYFFVKSDDPGVDQLPLKSTTASVNISGVIADVRVTQVYKNEGKRPIEAIYVFPASTRAAVYGMKMTIGERVIEAKIAKRDDARREYERAREEGKSASLLEQQRPNVFQMNVANIMPGDEIKVVLKYTELLVPTERVYEFMYPPVVGPRYSNQAAESAPPSERWVQNPYLHEGELTPYKFDIAVSISAGMPIKDLTCSSHKVQASYNGPTSAVVHLDGSEQSGGNRDYILRYRLGGDKIQSGLLLYEGEKEKFFLLMMEPPSRVKAENIPGREYIFIVDVSGSMHGFPLEISKKLLKDLIGNLRQTDRFNVLLFSGGSSVMSGESLPATPGNIQQAIHLIERQRGGGGTELLPALERALKLPRPENFSRTIVIATDGYVHVETQAFDLIRNSLQNANMFAFGIGSSVNRHLIEGMARVGMGEPFVIMKPDEAPAQAERFRRMIQSPVLTRVRVDFKEFKTYDVEPVSIPDVLAERPVIVFGKWRGNARGQITLNGVSGSGSHRDVIDVSAVKPSKENAALRYLWARHRIAILSDYNKLRPDDGRINEVTDLGLKYNLLTAYTSFVAVDTEVRNTGEKPTTIKQPLPLPQGVSDYAVGGAVACKMSAQLSMPAAREEASRDASGRTEGKGAILSIRDVKVSGGLTKEAVYAVFEKHRPELERCYSGKGEITLALVIGKDGSVKSVKTMKITLKDKNAGSCIAGQAGKWLFPAPLDRKEAKVTMTIVFRS
ncbi:MAG: VIT domain-containing protein [Deltaproteobacteria bacterium]|nr:VIT domain-containing protein [Deltaproteobacteria bacterium]